MKRVYKKNGRKIGCFKLKKTFMVLLTGLLLFSGCGSDSPPTVDGPDAPIVEPDPEPIELDLSYLPMGKGSADPYLKGTFIDFWNKGNWSESDWDGHMKEMKEVGVETLVVQFTAYGDNLWVDSSNDFSANIYPESLPRLLDAAAKENIGVYVGLYFNDEYWNKATDVSTLKLHAQRSEHLADDIWSLNKDKTAFKGWYITHEPAPYYYSTQRDFNVLKNNLINPIAEHCRTISGKPVGMSMFFNYNLTDLATFKTFIERLGTSNIELLILQDGVGVAHSDLASLGPYYAAANEALYDTGFKGAFWADLETFINVTSDSSEPETIERVKQKLTAVNRYVSFIVTFQYYQDMSPTGPKTTMAEKLRNDYLDYLP